MDNPRAVITNTLLGLPVGTIFTRRELARKAGLPLVKVVRHLPVYLGVLINNCEHKRGNEPCFQRKEFLSGEAIPY